MTARLAIRVQPGARRAGLDGRTAEGVLKVKLRAPAREGRANQALTELLAEVLGVPRRALQLVRGAQSRDKVIEVQGLTMGALESRIAAAIAQTSEER
jgi:hypothetical protein